ncbi:phytoene desaturase [Labedella populi]|uniref:Phytoene desaturase n=2 Tax=Labedella populi TaxID=2498850 RepID=A0A3S4A2D5_9MICO|nr:phytoene desaturase [Labedella populi]
MTPRHGAPERTVVIGGGISGLATAALLARSGRDVTLLEKNDELGGRASLLERDGFRFDLGPSWFLMPEVFDHFFRLMGTSSAEQLDLVRLEPGYRVYSEGHTEPIDIAATRAENVALFESIERGSGARLERYLDSAGEVYELAKRRFLYTTFESLTPLLAADVIRELPRFVKLFGTDLDSAAGAVVSDDRLRQILGYPAVFLGSSPYTTPSMYHLMSHLDLEDGVYYPRGGFARVIEAIADLAREAGVRIETGASVRRIRTEAARRRRARATGVEWTDTAGDPHVEEASVVVSAADLHHTETKLLPPALRTYPQSYWDRKTPGPGAVLLSLGVRGELPELLHHTLFFTKDWRSNFDAIGGPSPYVPDPASLYVCKPSATDAVAPEGHENLFVLVPIPADPSLGGGSSDTIRAAGDRAIAQIADWADIPDLAERITVRHDVGPADFVESINAWRGTMLGPAHTLAQSALFRAGNASKRVDGLVYAGGSTIPGIGLPMCLISAELVVKRLNGDTSTEALPVPLQTGHE